MANESGKPGILSRLTSNRTDLAFGTAGVAGAGLLLSGLLGRSRTNPETGEQETGSIFNWKTLIGGVMGVAAFATIAKRHGALPEQLSKIIPFGGKSHGV